MKLVIYDANDTYNPPSIHITKEDLEKYGNGDTFIETGTYLGQTVDMILESELFKKIHTVELNSELFDNAVIKYKDNDSVHLWLGDSIDILKEDIVPNLTGPATFWLDAHASGPLTGGKSGGSPVLDELDIIDSSPCKEHTIIIDDCRLFGSAEWDYVKKEDAIARIMKINPNYKLYYTDGQIPGDVIWATVR